MTVQRGVEAVAWSKKMRAKQSGDLLNSIVSKLGVKIVWADRTYLVTSFIDTGQYPLWFKEHGNKYAYQIEFFSNDVALVERMVALFPAEFPYGGKVKEEYGKKVLREFGKLLSTQTAEPLTP